MNHDQLRELLPLHRAENGVYSNYPREENVMVLIYENLNNIDKQDIVKELIYKKLLYRSKGRFHLSKAQY